LSGILPDTIQLSIEPGHDELAVMADSVQIERIIMNLVVNARDAMPDGGSLSISTGEAVIDNEFIRTRGYGKRGTYAYVSVKDTGTGMDAAVQKRIFEPFFTTKGAGKGTGFGLSIVYDIIKDHDGYIDVTSTLGAGTTFTVYLPLSLAAREHDAPAPEDDQPGGRETILLAENDDDPRKSARTVLEEFGYIVLTAKDGEDALRIYREHKDVIRLVITDMLMTKMNGWELYKGIIKIHPGAKVLFTSGYAQELLLNTGFLAQGMPFLAKPASKNDLLTKVRALFDNRE
jgi:CheY-like chemotaxis protein